MSNAIPNECPCGCGGPALLVGLELEPGVFVAADPAVMARAVNDALGGLPREARALLGIMGELPPPVPGYRYNTEYLLEEDEDPEPEPHADTEPTTSHFEDPEPWTVGPDGNIERGSRG